MNEVDENKAKQRFITLNLVRLIGVVMVLFAIAFSQTASNIPAVLNMLLAAAGLGVFFFLPRKLASQWKSEDK